MLNVIPVISVFTKNDEVLVPLCIRAIYHFDPSISTKLHADDLKRYTDIAIHSDTTSFQHQSYSLMIAHLATIFSKCNTMQLVAHLVPPHIPPLHIADQLLTSTTSLTDLGIKFDNNLKINDHVQDLVNRAYQRSNKAVSFLKIPTHLSELTKPTMYVHSSNIIQWSGHHPKSVISIP